MQIMQVVLAGGFAFDIVDRVSGGVRYFNTQQTIFSAKRAPLLLSFSRQKSHAPLHMLQTSPVVFSTFSTRALLL